MYDANVEEWTSILKLAHQWDFNEVKALAVRELENLGVPPLQKIVLYQKYAIDRKLLKPALTALTMRDEPLSIEEGRELSLETALELAKAREIARAPVFTNKKNGNPRSPVNLVGAELDSLIKDVFRLPSSTGPEPSTSQTPTGRDTPQPNTQTSGGSNSHQSHQCAFVDTCLYPLPLTCLHSHGGFCPSCQWNEQRLHAQYAQKLELF